MAPSVATWLLEKAQHRRLRGEIFEVVARADAKEGAADPALVLLRALHLERQLRVASALRQREAMAGLARSIVEAVLVGLYLAADDEHGNRLNIDAERRLERIMKPWSPEGDSPIELARELLALPDGPGMLTYSQLADHIDATFDLGTYFDAGLGSYLYRHWYAPLSNLAVHTTGLSIARQYAIGGGGTARTRPWGVLPRRGAIRACDGAIAILGAVIADQNDLSSTWLRRYGARQIETANVPAVVLLLQTLSGIVRALGFRGVVRVASAVVSRRPRSGRAGGADVGLRVGAVPHGVDPAAWSRFIERLVESVEGQDPQG